MIKAAIFDLDHTLFDRYATLRSIVHNTPNALMPFKEDIPRDIIADYFVYNDKHYIHYGWDKMYDEFSLQGALKDGVEKKDFFEKHIIPIYMREAILFPFTIPTLQKIRDMGIIVGLITNGVHELQYKKLEMLGITDMFDEIIVSEDFGVHKPDTSIFEEMSRRLNISPENMLYIGDNPINDIEPSRRVGYTPVWIKTTGCWIDDNIELPEFQADTIEAVPKIIEKLNKLKG